MKHRDREHCCLFLSVYLVVTSNKTAQIVHRRSWFLAELLPLSHEIQGQKVKLKVAKLKNKVVRVLYETEFSLHPVFLCMLVPLGPLWVSVLPGV